MRYVKSIARITVLFFACRILRASEPMCLSRFDYDEKMLLKILRFEDALEKFDKKISDIVDMFDNNERKRNSETKEAVDKAKLDVKQIMEHIQQNISNVLMHDSRNIRTQLQEVETLRAKMREELKCKEQPQVMFNARVLSGDYTFVRNQDVVFKEVLISEGGGYNSNTGHFTVSIPGVYMFNVQICSLHEQNSWFELVHNGSPLQKSAHFGGKGWNTCVDMQAYAKIALGGKVWVRSTSNSRMYADTDRWNTFAGMLIRI